MSQISCIGRDGITRIFDYSVSQSAEGGWTFRVRSDPPPASGDFFELGVEKVGLTTVRVVIASHFLRPEYKAMGIPEALLPEIKRVLSLSVESSPTSGATTNVYRTPAATKYWDRLKAAGGATYDSKRDVYTVI